MRDERFTRYPDSQHYATNLQRGRCAEQALWFSAVTEVIYTWCRTAALRSAAPYDENSMLVPNAVVQERLEKISCSLVEAIMGVVSTPPFDELACQAAWVWGTALGRVALDLLDEPDRFALVQRSLGQNPVAAEAFLVAFATSLVDAPCAPLRSYLESIATRAAHLEGMHLRLFSTREDSAERLETWWTTATIHNLWNEQLYDMFPADGDDLWLLDALRRVDKETYVHLLEETHNPAIVRRMLSGWQIREDSAELLALLAVAPPTWVDARSINGMHAQLGGMTAPLVLDALAQHILLLIRSITLNDGSFDPTDLDVFLHRDIPQLCDETVATLQGRSDAPILGIQWLIHLAHRTEGITPRNGVVPEWILGEAVAAALARAGGGIDEWRKACPDVFASVGDKVGDLLAGPGLTHGLGPRSVHDLDVLLGLLAVLNHNVIERDVLSEFISLFVALLARRDPGLWPGLDYYVPSFRHACGAVLLLADLDPIATWDKLWHALGEQRRRADHAQYTGDTAARDPSLFVLRMGIGALAALLALPEQNKHVLLLLWERLFVAARSVVLQQNDIVSDTAWQATLPLLFAYLPYSYPNLSPDAIRDALLLLGGDDDLVMRCAVALYNSAVPGEIVVASTPGGAPRLQGVVERHDATAKPRVLNSPETTMDQCRRMLMQAAL